MNIGLQKATEIKKKKIQKKKTLCFSTVAFFFHVRDLFFHRSFVITQSIYLLTGGAQKACAYLISNLSYLNSVIKATIAEICYLMSCSQAGSLISTDPSASKQEARR